MSDEHLSPIYWIHRARHLPELDDSIVDEALDYCRVCVEIAVAELKKQHPQWAENIMTDGGWDPYRLCDYPPNCERCGCRLSCSIVDDRGVVTAECIDTAVAWDAADAVFADTAR